MIAAVGLVTAVVSLLGLYLVAHRTMFAVAAFVLVIVQIVLAVVVTKQSAGVDQITDSGKRQKSPAVQFLSDNIISLFAAIFLALGLALGDKFLMQAGMEWSMLAGVVFGCSQLYDRYKARGAEKQVAHRVKLISAFVVGIVIIVASLPVMLSPFLLDGYLLSLRTVEISNVTNAVQQEPVTWENDYTLTQDISYESEFQNGYFDLYTPNDKAKTHPVFIYVHGGGFCSGDKNAWNPDSMGAGFVRLAKAMLDKGYAVVTPNYELTPDGENCGDPTPVNQMDELAIYLQNNESSLGLDMSHVVLGGGSAGGYIAAEYAVWQVSRATNAQGVEEGIDWLYSDFTGTPSLDPANIKALYLGCALLDPKRFSNTGDVFTDYKFHQMAVGYFEDWYADTPRFDDGSMPDNIIDLVTVGFPPTYIVDGNHGSFADQARDLADRLEALGVRHAECIFDSNYGTKVPHGFDAGTDSAETQQAIAGFMDFLG